MLLLPDLRYELLVSVMLGYGVYQEWHHAALALGVFSAFLNRTD